MSAKSRLAGAMNYMCDRYHADRSKDSMDAYLLIVSAYSTVTSGRETVVILATNDAGEPVGYQNTYP